VDQDRRPDHRPHLPLLLTHLRTGTLEQRSQGRAWELVAAATSIPRDGGMADLLAAARSPQPPFAAVVCEDIERSARDTFNSLKLERELNDQGIQGHGKVVK
jgi:hypothetical protein